MFKSLDEMIRFNRSRLDVAWDALLRWVSGVLVAGAGFQALYSMLFAFE